MLEIPFVKSPDKNACALASYAMVVGYFFPGTTVQEISEISDWEPGYVVWAFKFWLWLMDNGIKVTEYDRIDYKAWSEKGIEGLKESTSEQEFKFYQDNTKDLNSYQGDIQKVWQHKNFVHNKRNPTFTELEVACSKGLVCELVLNSQTLDQGSQFTLHRVVPLEVNKDFVTFHDPDIGPNRRVRINLFKKSWLETVSEPELCVYQRIVVRH